MGSDIEEQQRTGPAAGQAPGIVRGGTRHPRDRWIGRAAPALAGAAVVLAHAATTPLDGWVDPALAEAIHALAALVEWAARLLPWVPGPMALVLVSLATTAVAIGAMAWLVQHQGLGTPAALLLALIAASAPLMWTHATVPSGTSLIVAGSALVAVILRHERAWGEPRHAGHVLAGLALVLVAAAAWMSRDATARLLATELGGPGVLLAIIGGTRRDGWPLLVGGAAAIVVTAAGGPLAQTAAALPWAWTLAASGIVALSTWRHSHGMPAVAGAGRRWVVVGLAGWLALHVVARPWQERAEMITLQALWARAVADAAGQQAVLAAASLSASRQVDAWRPHSANRSTGAGALVLPDAVETLRWSGALIAPGPAPLAPIAEVLGALPSPLLVVAGVSREAAPALTGADWQALGRIGLRPPTGRPQAHVAVGVTGARLQGRDAADAVRATLALLPGDLLAPTRHPSPVDVGIEAAANVVVLQERGRERARVAGALVAVYRLDGTLLALWHGAGGRWLGAASPGGSGPPVRRLAARLPCRDVAGGQDVDVTALSREGAVGVAGPSGTPIRVATRWPDDAPTATPWVQAGGRAGDRDTQGIVSTEIGPEGLAGLHLGGVASAVVLRAAADVTVCAALPEIPMLSPGGTPIALPPSDASIYARGWHAAEPTGDGAAFRWSDGRTGVLLVGLSAPLPAPVEFTLTAQNAGQPSAGDTLSLIVNGRPLGPRPLAEGLHAYRWTISAGALRPGLNELTLATSLTVRPSDLAAGQDARLLGVAVHAASLSVGRDPGSL